MTGQTCIKSKSSYTALLISSFFSLIAGSVAAADLQVNEFGKLTGAKNVNVGDKIYDIVFVDGTFENVFGSPLSPNAFFFNNITEAGAASQSLIDSVFVDSLDYSFDTDPELTLGCSDPNFCNVYTPFEYRSQGDRNLILNAITQNNYHADNGENNTGYIGDIVNYTFIYHNLNGIEDPNFADNSISTWAKWSNADSVTPVPEPTTYMMMFIGLLTILGLIYKNHFFNHKYKLVL